MHTEFTSEDLAQLPALQPPTWGNLIPRFEYFIKSEHCKPIKIAENGEVVAIGTSILHGDTAWLACIITHPEHRKKGLGNAMTLSLISELDRAKYPTIYLDATEFGFPVYLKIGFELEELYLHFRREKPLLEHVISKQILPSEEKWKAGIFEVDKIVSGEERSGVLSDFLANAFVYVENAQVLGYYIPDWGDNPIMAVTNQAGLELMKLRNQTNDEARLPESNIAAIQFLKENGFTQFQTSRRMFLGTKRIWKADKIFNRISGQLG
ncbi:GNAT family N-acetyltransferase [Dyadobacter luticola]|uniref:GNAT family N-acetyltransferase n=1 Tax=Dyadobacter luticola TaxID=1979387 RepID=A0A5R9L3F9_9BACT|nr:GNAT family N-acetyltransferase [Dyadobacter luticola]TLV03112.1 GNAT family N-acetyltransferase [Dyadobacter luticola]